MEITLTEQELALIFQALGELPLKMSGPLFSKLQQQAMRAQTSTQQTVSEDHSTREF